MQVIITIPVEIDDPLTSAEYKQLQQHVMEFVKSKAVALSDRIDTDARMFGTVCRFRFRKPSIKIA